MTVDRPTFLSSTLLPFGIPHSTWNGSLLASVIWISHGIASRAATLQIALDLLLLLWGLYGHILHVESSYVSLVGLILLLHTHK